MKYGETVAYSGATPTKEKTAQYSYAFSSWDKPLENITNNCDRYAQYASSINQYTVQFVNYDGSVLQTNAVDYGSSVEYAGAKPSKPADDDYGYVFTGWDNSTSAITGDVTATAQFSKADYLDYVLNGEETAYVVYKSASATIPNAVAIPSTYKNKPVVKIGSSAFKDCSFSKIVIDAPLTEIGAYAFSDCYNLHSISLPNTLITIGRGAFGHCNLESITIPDSVTSFAADGVFGGDEILKTVVFGSSSSITELPFATFYYCQQLEEITLPSLLKTIGGQCFDTCKSLTSIVLPDSVTTIGHGAFGDCVKLASITLDDSLTTLDGDCFRNCSALRSIALPANLIMIQRDLFSGCQLLSEVTYKGTVSNFKVLTNGFFSDLLSPTRASYVQCSDGKVTLS